MKIKLDSRILPLCLLARFFCYFLISSSAILAIHFYDEQRRFKFELEELQREDILRLQLAAKTVAGDMQNMVADLRWLSNSQTLLDYQANDNEKNTKRLQNDLKNFAVHAARYDQIRYIGANGWERVRINYNNGKPVVVPDSRLQDKSQRYYFRNALQLNRNQLYFSPLDLNVENGEIEQPLKPMIRGAMPLFRPGEQEPDGVLVLNYLASNVLSHFEAIMDDSWGKPMLLNRQGYWLYSTQEKDEWGFMWKNDRTFGNRFPEAWSFIENIESGTIVTGEGQFNYISLFPYAVEGLKNPDGGADQAIWKIVSQVEPEKLTAKPWWNISDHGLEAFAIVLLTAFMNLVLAAYRCRHSRDAKALENSEKRYRNTLENMAEGYVLQQALCDEGGDPYDYRFLDANSAAERLLNRKREELIGKTVLGIFPDIDEHWLDVLNRVVVSGEAMRVVDYGKAFASYFEVNASSPELGLVAVFFTDVTERKLAEELLRQDATVFNNTQEAIIITDEKHNIIRVNDAYSEITGFSLEDVFGKNPKLHQSGNHDEAFYNDLWHSLETKGQWQGEIWNRRKNGELFPVWENISVVKDEQQRVTHYVAVMSDISSIKQAEQQLEFMAHHDALTGLPNRLMLEVALKKDIQRARRHNRRLALLFMDLDDFKPVNDTYGHAMGDRLLKEIGKRLETGIRSVDIAARIGGDEFVIVSDELSESGNAAVLAERIASVVSEPIRLDEHQLTVSISIGISIYPDDADNIEALIKAADVAMYFAKNDRKSYCFYSEVKRDDGGM